MIHSTTKKQFFKPSPILNVCFLRLQQFNIAIKIKKITPGKEKKRKKKNYFFAA